LYEGGIRVPFIAYMQGLTSTGAVNDMPAVLWDLFPTFLQLASIHSTKKTDGISLLPALKGHHQNQHDYFYWELHESGGKQAVRVGNWKGIKLNVTTKNDSQLELYDLNSDPYEKKNIASQHPDIVKKIDGIIKEAYIPNNDWPLLLSEVKKAN